MKEWILTLSGCVLLCLVLWDAFITIFSLRGSGPLTRRWTSALWRLLLWLHRRRPVHGVLGLAGPAMLVGAVLVWYAGLLASFFLIFLADGLTILGSDADTPAGPLETLYFVSNTTSTVGYGDFLPNGLPWTLLTGASAVITTILITVSLSFVISVLSAAITRTHMAQSIFSTGRDAVEFIENARFRDGHSPLTSHYISLAAQVDHMAQSHNAFPILYFFHNKRPDQSPARALLLLSDSLFVFGLLAEHRRPPTGLLRMLESAIDAYLEHATFGLRQVEPSSDRARRVRSLACDLVPYDELPADYEERLQEYMEHRVRVEALCLEDGWLPEAPAAPSEEDS